MVTLVPAGPVTGRKVVIPGPTVKVALEADPPGVVTVIGPVVAPAGTVVVIWIAETTVKDEAGVPLKLTAVAPVRLVPLIVTAVPAGPPPAGTKPVIVGGWITVNAVELFPAPDGVVTDISPVVALGGTVVVI